jgi:hypothetical protein
MSDAPPTRAPATEPPQGPIRCGACGRAIAAALPHCLYCGAALPERPAPPVETPDAEADTGAMLVVIDTTAGERALVAALGLSAAEAGVRCRRGRYQLYRILPGDEAEFEAQSLGHHGIASLLLPEIEVRRASRPLVARGGDPQAGLFWLESRSQTARVEPGEALALLWGSIRREQPRQYTGPMRDQRRAAGGSVQEEDFYHVHRRSDARPLEITPSAFEFSGAQGALESSVLRVQRALETLAPGMAIDRSFAAEAPALGVSAGPAAGGVTAFGDALRSQPSVRAQNRPSGAPLDNLAQFRFYSAWRGLLARRLPG